MEQRSQKRVHYKAINARYKAVRMRGNYLRTNQPKPGTTAAVHQEIIDPSSNGPAVPFRVTYMCTVSIENWLGSPPFSRYN